MKLCNHMCLFISSQITTTWNRFARNLEVEDTVIDQIEAAENSFKDKVIGVINYFNAEKGELKWNQTKNVLKEIKLDIVIVKFEEKYLQTDQHHLNCGE